MKDWARNDYNNAVGAIVKWFWEPLSDNCKETVKMLMKYGDNDTVLNFYDAVCLCQMGMIAVEDDPEFDGYFSESDAENLDQLLVFIDKYDDQLRKFSVRPTMVIDED